MFILIFLQSFSILYRHLFVSQVHISLSILLKYVLLHFFTIFFTIFSTISFVFESSLILNVPFSFWIKSSFLFRNLVRRVWFSFSIKVRNWIVGMVKMFFLKEVSVKIPALLNISSRRSWTRLFVTQNFTVLFSTQGRNRKNSTIC